MKIERFTSVLFLVSLLTIPAFAQAPLYDISGPPSSEFGHAIDSVGDVDGDGFDDLAVGAPRAAGLEPDAGCVYILIQSIDPGLPAPNNIGLSDGKSFFVLP